MSKYAKEFSVFPSMGSLQKEESRIFDQDPLRAGPLPTRDYSIQDRTLPYHRFPKDLLSQPAQGLPETLGIAEAAKPKTEMSSFHSSLDKLNKMLTKHIESVPRTVLPQSDDEPLPTTGYSYSQNYHLYDNSTQGHTYLNSRQNSGLKSGLQGYKPRESVLGEDVDELLGKRRALLSGIPGGLESHPDPRQRVLGDDVNTRFNLELTEQNYEPRQFPSHTQQEHALHHDSLSRRFQNYHQQSADTGVFLGSASKPPNIREGDWLCANCDNINWSRRIVCNL